MRGVRPILRWAGSKQSSLDALASFFTEGSRYLEPFCGSAALFFRLNPRQAVLSDLNKDLISFYTIAAEKPEEVYDLAVSFRRTADHYYRLRAEFNTATDTVRKAALFFYLNKNCFNGLFRTSRSGTFNVPFSPSRTGEYVCKTQFVARVEQLRTARLECADFESSITQHCRRHDFVFLDPPYSAASRYPFREYYPGCFSKADTDRLLNVLDLIEARRAQFVLTFSNAIDWDIASRGWHALAIRTRRNIAGFAGARKYVEDVIVTNIRAL